MNLYAPLSSSLIIRRVDKHLMPFSAGVGDGFWGYRVDNIQGYGERIGRTSILDLVEVSLCFPLSTNFRSKPDLRASAIDWHRYRYERQLGKPTSPHPLIPS